MGSLFDARLALDTLPFVLEGIGLTLLIATVSFIIALMLGLLLAVMRISDINILSGVARLYISFFRGVPTLVALFFIYFGLPFAGVEIPAVPSALLGFGLTSSAYVAEIIRAAILGVDRGQWDAAGAFGFSYTKTLTRIIFPQAFKISVPALGNVVLSLIKGTSLAAMITVPEIFQRSQIVGGANFDYMTMYAVVAIVYWMICLVYEFLQEQLEKKLNVNDVT